MTELVPGVNFEATSPKGDGSWHFVDGVDGEMQMGMHLLRLGVRPPELWTGSNSKLRFNVTQAILTSFLYVWTRRKCNTILKSKRLGFTWPMRVQRIRLETVHGISCKEGIIGSTERKMPTDNSIHHQQKISDFFPSALSTP